MPSIQPAGPDTGAPNHWILHPPTTNSQFDHYGLYTKPLNHSFTPVKVTVQILLESSHPQLSQSAPDVTPGCINEAWYLHSDTWVVGVVYL